MKPLDTHAAAQPPVARKRGRRFNAAGGPGAPLALTATAFLLVLLTIAASWATIAAARSAIGALGQQGPVIDTLFVLLAIASVLLIVPTVKSMRHCLQVRAARKINDLIAVRVAAANARNQDWIAIGYSVAQWLILLFVSFLIANNMEVSKTFFYLPLIKQTLPLVLEAFWVNIKIFLIAEVLVLIWGLVLALATFAPGVAGKPVRIIATVYIDIFRSVPVILTIYLIGFGIPLTGVPILKDLSLQTFVIIALTLTVGAYVAEVYRAGILSIHWSQTAAARSLGLSHMQTLRFVVIPQGVRQIIPPLLNSFIALQKDTALISVIGAIDAFNQAMMIASNHYNLSAVSTVAVLFILITIPQTRLVERMMRRDRARLRAGGN